MLNWDAIETVLLDMDGTLLDLHFDDYLWRDYLPKVYARAHGQDETHAKAELELKYAAARHSLDWYCLDYWTQQLGVDVHRVERDLARHIALRPGASAFLERLATTRKRRLMATNAHPKSLALKMEITGLERHFEALVSAHHYGHAKESTRFWQRLCAAHAVDPDTTLLVDDNLDALQAARDYGIRFVCAVSRPNSRCPPVDTRDFAAVESFDDIWPPTTAA